MYAKPAKSAPSERVENAFETLGVTANMTDQQIAEAYRTALSAAHPDQNPQGDPADAGRRTRLLITARDILKNHKEQHLADVQDLALGQSVEISGLEQRPHLNGVVGRVEAFNGLRYTVCGVAVRRRNLVKLSSLEEEMLQGFAGGKWPHVVNTLGTLGEGALCNRLWTLSQSGKASLAWELAGLCNEADNSIAKRSWVDRLLGAATWEPVCGLVHGALRKRCEILLEPYEVLDDGVRKCYLCNGKAVDEGHKESRRHRNALADPALSCVGNDNVPIAIQKEVQRIWGARPAPAPRAPSPAPAPQPEAPSDPSEEPAPPAATRGWGYVEMMKIDWEHFETMLNQVPALLEAPWDFVSNLSSWRSQEVFEGVRTWQQVAKALLFCCQSWRRAGFDVPNKIKGNLVEAAMRKHEADHEKPSKIKHIIHELDLWWYDDVLAEVQLVPCGGCGRRVATETAWGYRAQERWCGACWSQWEERAAWEEETEEVDDSQAGRW